MWQLDVYSVYFLPLGIRTTPLNNYLLLDISHREIHIADKLLCTDLRSHRVRKDLKK